MLDKPPVVARHPTRGAYVLLASAALMAAAYPWGDTVGHLHWAKVEWLPFTSRDNRITDVIANVLLGGPLGIAAGLMFRRGVLAAALTALVISLSVESMQVFSHSRFPSATDVLCNVAGAALAAFAVRRWRAGVGTLGGAALVATVVLGIPSQGWAQSAENVAVVINQASQASIRIGEQYARARGLPPANVIRITSSTQDSISREEFEAAIETPIGAALKRTALYDRILYLVLTKDVPLRVSGSAGLDGTTASVDSELTLLYRKLTGALVPLRGPVDNPYYLGARPIRDASPFTHRSYDIFLVSRLDAFTVEDAMALIQRAQTPASTGQIVLDQRASPGAPGDDWLSLAASRLRDIGLGDLVVLDGSPRAARGAKQVIGYYSSGSNDPENRTRRFELDFVAGAIAGTFVSTDARTFQRPPQDWKPSADWSSSKAIFAGSPQTLTGDLIAEGVTGVAGHVAEPYLQSIVRPQILFPAYLSGFNLIEAFYLAIPHLGWQTVVIGDPLCRAVPRRVLTHAEIEEPVDDSTDLPGLFSRRRKNLAEKALADVPAAVVSLLLLAETRSARGDNGGARAALEQATEILPTLSGAQLQLALLYEQAGEFDRAAATYRVVLKSKPDTPLALNNLAYLLAVRLNAPAEARPLAERATTLAPGDPTMVDTLAWIEYLLGNHPEALRLIARASKELPGNADVRLHAAFIHAAAGALAVSDLELKAALKLDPSLVERADVRELQARIAKGRVTR